MLGNDEWINVYVWNSMAMAIWIKRDVTNATKNMLHAYDA